MRLKTTKSKNSLSFYVIKDIYKNGKRTTTTIETLGTEQAVIEKAGGGDPYEWAKAYIAELNKKEKEEQRQVIIKKKQSKRIPKGVQQSFNGGYLFLQDIYYSLQIDKICNDITTKYKFTFDLNDILSRLLYGRILYPSSKLNTFKLSKKLLEQPNFELQHIYRALEVIAKESDFIQSSLYQNSLKLSKRNDKILYYDCTNYFFEIEQEEGLKQYGFSKEHRPNPIVQMGLFMDGDGIPLAFSINKGNTNEQVTLKPLEENILNDFKLSKFIVCTDAGLSSYANRKFNIEGQRNFITTQSIKTLKAFLKEWAISPDGWKHKDSSTEYNLTDLNKKIETLSGEAKTDLEQKTFYKERWINENGLEQRLIVTFSFKYQKYQRAIREKQIERALKKIDSSPNSIGKVRQNDYKRLIKTTVCTKEGEVADNKVHDIDTDTIENEMIYDGFYGVCTSLESDDAGDIIRINKRRWQIEECFRIIKTEFKARPVYLSRDDRINAHFTTCFLALTLFRYLEKQLNSEFTASEMISELREMNFYHELNEGYIPTYTRTDFTDALHDSFGFNTDYEIVSTKNMKKIFKDTKNRKKVRKK